MDQAEFDKKSLDLACMVVNKRHAPLFLFLFQRESELCNTPDLEFRLDFISTVVHEIKMKMNKTKNQYGYITLFTRAGLDSTDGLITVPLLSTSECKNSSHLTLTAHLCDCHRANHWGHFTESGSK